MCNDDEQYQNQMDKTLRAHSLDSTQDRNTQIIFREHKILTRRFMHR